MSTALLTVETPTNRLRVVDVEIVVPVYNEESDLEASVHRLHRYLTDHAYGVATTDDLRQAFLDATGENLD